MDVDWPRKEETRGKHGLQGTGLIILLLHVAARRICLELVRLMSREQVAATERNTQGMFVLHCHAAVRARRRIWVLDGDMLLLLLQCGVGKDCQLVWKC